MKVTIPAKGEILRDCECIHQEVAFKAAPARVYQALTDEKQFAKVTNFVMPGATTSLSPDAGGAFSLFNGMISGRNVQMIPNERLVQAWRPESWPQGIYSIAKFQLNAEGAGTRLIFDHTGFPKGDAEALASGWKEHYWDTLRKFLT